MVLFQFRRIELDKFLLDIDVWFIIIDVKYYFIYIETNR